MNVRVILADCTDQEQEQFELIAHKIVNLRVECGNYDKYPTYNARRLPDNMSSLKTLYFYDWRITSLPQGMVSLEVLHVVGNNLTSLPDDLTSLRQLYCWSNQLTSLPLGMKNLKIMYCGNNPIASLPNDMTSLEQLLCSKCHLSSLNLSNSPRLKVLHCDYNNISSLEGISTTRILDCSNNKLKFLPEGMTSLVKLRCVNNQLRTLPDDMSLLEEIYTDFHEIVGPDSYHLLCKGNSLPFYSNAKSATSSQYRT